MINILFWDNNVQILHTVCISHSIIDTWEILLLYDHYRQNLSFSQKIGIFFSQNEKPFYQSVCNQLILEKNSSFLGKESEYFSVYSATLGKSGFFCHFL